MAEAAAEAALNEDETNATRVAGFVRAKETEVKQDKKKNENPEEIAIDSGSSDDDEDIPTTKVPEAVFGKLAAT